jgi:hypothetical protein
LQLREQYNQNSAEYNGDLNSGAASAVNLFGLGAAGLLCTIRHVLDAFRSGAATVAGDRRRTSAARTLRPEMQN